MSSAVYFASVCARGDAESKMMKVRRLFDAAGFADCVAPHDFVAIKIHFGEPGSDASNNHVFARQVVDRVHALGGHPFLTDTHDVQARPVECYRPYDRRIRARLLVRDRELPLPHRRRPPRAQGLKRGRRHEAP